VSDGLSAGAKYQAPRAPVVVTIAAGRFQPVVVALLAGQPLELRNTDATPRRVRGSPAGGRPFTVEVSPSGGTARRYFSATAAPMRIDMASDPGGVAWVAVLRHPFFAVTGPDGRYALRGLPPGTYTVAAWHPRAGTLAATVTVSGGDARAPDFRFAAP